MNISNELEKFKKFKETYIFNYKEIEVINEKEYCDGICLTNEEGKPIGESDKWINVGYNNEGNIAKILSNLFPYKFTFREKEFSSIEAFFQGIKFKDINMQNYVFEYSGIASNRIKACNDYNWKESGILYWQGKEINRFSKEYEDLIDEMYVSAIQNPLYRNALKICDKYIMHSIGDLEQNDTVFTRYEFEKELNCLKDFLKEID